MIFTHSRQQNEQFTRRTIPVGLASRVEARVEMNVGTLRVAGGADALVDGAFRYAPDLEPVIDYDEAEGVGRLAIRQPRPIRMSGGSGRNEWDIALSDTTPLDLMIVQTTGDGRFDLSSVMLQSLALDRATGSTSLRLAGDHRDLRRARVESATGSLALNFTGRYAALTSLEVSSGAGRLKADLRGLWGCDVTVRLHVATGSIDVRLPDGIGIELHGSTGLGRVAVSGLAAGRGGWRRDAPAGAPVMRLDVSTAVGSIVIEANP